MLEETRSTTENDSEDEFETEDEDSMKVNLVLNWGQIKS